MKCQRSEKDREGYDADSDSESNSEISSSSMSDYGNDLMDVELEMRRDRTRPLSIIRNNDIPEKNIYKK